MKDNKEFELLSDLAKLIKKYGPQTFEDLAQALVNPSFIERFAEVIKTTASVARSTRRKVRKSSGNSRKLDFRSSLFSLGMDGAEKGALLMDLYDGLKAKTLLPTLREMQSFVSDNGLPAIKATSREKALVPFVKAFFPMPIEEVREYLKRIQPASNSEDRSLEGWSNIIFDHARRR
jgi:hypothetical protein